MNSNHVFDLTKYEFNTDAPPSSCYWAPDCIQCLAYTGSEEDRYPSKCDICLKPLTDHEGYADDNETWCNLCAEEEEINQLYCANCEMRFNDKDILRSTNNNGVCEFCNDLLDLPVNTRSRCDDTPPTKYITCCNCGAEESEYSSYHYKSSVYCNKCACEVCGQKPKSTFKVEPKTFECTLCTDNHDWQDRNMVDGNLFCGPCYWHLELQPKPTLFGQYSSEEKMQLARYAEEHNLTMEEALDYQTHCHCCGKIVENAVFDENHQYCGERCWVTCEEYRYPCFKKGDCKVCETLCQVEQSMVDDN